MDPFRPRVANPKVIMVGRRYSLVHRPGLYLINDTKDPNARGELFQVGERSQALRRYRQLEAHSVRGALPHRSGRGVPARRRNVAARSWVAARMVPERRRHALVPIVVVLSVVVLVAIMLIAVNSFHPDAADPEFSLGVGEVAVPTLIAGSGDPPRAELVTQDDEASAPDGAGQRHEGGRGDAVASDSGLPTGSSGAGSYSSTVQGTGSGGSGGGTGGSSSGGSSDSGSVDQGGGGTTVDSGSGPGGAGPGSGSGGGGGGDGSGGGGGGGG